MKRFIKLCLVMVLFLPILVFARNYNDAKNYAENHFIKNFMNPERYLVTNNSNEVKGSLITVDDFRKTMLNDTVVSSYLFDGTRYWAENQQIISESITQGGGQENLSFRVAENVKHKTRVKGNGKYATPWIFVDQYNVVVTAVEGRGIIKPLKGSEPEGVSAKETVSEGDTAEFKITAAAEFKYMSNNCGMDAEYNNDTGILSIKGISKDMSCDVTFTQSAGAKMLETPHQVVTSKIPTIGTKDRVFTAPTPGNFVVSRGIGYFRDESLNVRLGVLSSVPYRKGWNFYGYTVNGTTFIDKGVFQTDKTELFIKDAVVTFSIAPKEYTVRLNPNGGSGETITLENVKYEHDVPDVASGLPTKTGYTLVGYFNVNNKQFLAYNVSTKKATAAGNVWEVENENVKEHTLYAHWNANTYKFAYDYDKGTKGTYAPDSARYDTVATVSNPTRRGYLFQGWTISGHNTSTAKTGASSTTVTSAISGDTKNQYFKNLNPTDNSTVAFKATWKPITYTVTYNCNFGSGSTGRSDHTYDAAKNLTANGCSRLGYTFLGWNDDRNATTAKYRNGESVTNLADTQGATVTLYAIWSGNTYRITYNYDGGSKGTYAPSTGTYGSVVTISNPVKPSYKFTGWTISGYNTSTATTGATSGAVTSPISGKTKNQYFKNLHPTTNTTITFTASWILDSTFSFKYSNAFRYKDGSAGWVNANNASVTLKSATWEVRFLGSGTLTVNSISSNIDVFLVGGGGGAGGCDTTRGGGGGGGGYTTTQTNFAISPRNYAIAIGGGGGCGGGGGTSSAFGYSAAGGGAGAGYSNGRGGNGGSGGGGNFGGNGFPYPEGSGGSNGSNGEDGRVRTYPSNGNINEYNYGGSGCQNNGGCRKNGAVCRNTRAFCESSGELFAGGGAGGDHEYCGVGGSGGGGGSGRGGWCVCGCPGRAQANKGGGGAMAGGSSGIVIIRNKR